MWKKQKNDDEIFSITKNAFYEEILKKRRWTKSIALGA